jgi:hypothetical protein
MNKISGENTLLMERRFKQAALLSVVTTSVILVIGALSLILGGGRISLDGHTVDSLWVGLVFVAGGAMLMRRLLNNWDRIKDDYLLKGIDGVLLKLIRHTGFLSLFGLGAAVMGAMIFLSSNSVFDLSRAIVVALVIQAVGFPRKKIWRRIVGELEAV